MTDLLDYSCNEATFPNFLVSSQAQLLSSLIRFVILPFMSELALAEVSVVHFARITAFSLKVASHFPFFHIRSLSFKASFTWFLWILSLNIFIS